MNKLDDVSGYRERLKLEKKIGNYNYIRDQKEPTGLYRYCLLIRLIATIISKYLTFKWERWYG